MAFPCRKFFTFPITYETYIGGADPVNPEKTAVTQAAALLKWDIGKLYAEKNYTAEKRDAVYAMVEGMIVEYEAMLQEEDWLSQETRDRAVSKLKAVHLRIGAPEDITRHLSAYVPDPDKGYAFHTVQAFEKDVVNNRIKPVNGIWKGVLKFFLLRRSVFRCAGSGDLSDPFWRKLCNRQLWMGDEAGYGSQVC